MLHAFDYFNKSTRILLLIQSSAHITDVNINEPDSQWAKSIEEGVLVAHVQLIEYTMNMSEVQFLGEKMPLIICKERVLCPLCISFHIN